MTLQSLLFILARGHELYFCLFALKSLFFLLGDRNEVNVISKLFFSAGHSSFQSHFCQIISLISAFLPLWRLLFTSPEPLSGCQHPVLHQRKSVITHAIKSNSRALEIHYSHRNRQKVSLHPLSPVQPVPTFGSVLEESFLPWMNSWKKLLQGVQLL